MIPGHHFFVFRSAAVEIGDCGGQVVLAGHIDITVVGVEGHGIEKGVFRLLAA